MLTAAATLMPTACRRRHAGDLTMALGWVPDVEYADLWVALDRHYIADAGLHFYYLPGGPNAPQPVLEISAREADLGDSDWLPFCDAVAQGNDFVILASLFPITPIGLISLPAHPVRTPADLAHQRFLVQGSNERAILQALFHLNGLPETYTMVPVGFSPEPLLQGAGDAYFCFVTNQPQTLQRMGLHEDADFYVTRRGELVRFLTALLRGHFANAADPAYGARLAVERYGADLGLDLQQQTALNRLQIPLETEPGSSIPFWFSEANFVGPMYAAARVSGRPPLPPPASLRDMSLLEEAYHKLTEHTA